MFLLSPLQVRASIFSSCIKTARAYFGVEIPYGTDAVELSGNGIPTQGGLVLLELGRIGGGTISHVGVIQAFLKDGFWIGQGNVPKGELSYDFINYNSPKIRGFWSFKE